MVVVVGVLCRRSVSVSVSFVVICANIGHTHKPTHTHTHTLSLSLSLSLPKATKQCFFEGSFPFEAAHAEARLWLNREQRKKKPRQFDIVRSV